MTQPWRFRTSSRALFFLLAAAPVAALSPVAGISHAADVLQPAADDFSPIFEKAKSAVVRVEAGNPDFLLGGTGFFIDNQGTVLTSSTVIGDNTSARVVINGLKLEAKLLGNDPRSGLAMLKVAYGDSPFLPLGHPTDLKTGYAVMTIGYPLSLPVASSQGAVTGFDIGSLTRHFPTTHIHADASISPGQVGGPLLNARGEVIGLVVPSLDDGRSIYALPVEAMEKIMNDFTQYGRAKHGWVGVNVVEVPDTQRDGRTVRVVEITPGTPASKSGILRGDTVMRIDEREIYRPADVLDASFFSHVGETMHVVVRREDKLFNYNFAVIERPKNRAAATPMVAQPAGQATHAILVNQVTSGGQ